MAGTILYDKEDEDLFLSRKWHISDTGYAVWRGMLNGKKQTIRLHRLITNCPKDMVVDHINHDTLDNRKSNLRICTQKDNMRNKKEQGKGYWFHKQNKNWVVEINGNHIGSFKTEKEAIFYANVIRSGGTYKKPEQTECKYGHDLKNCYKYEKLRICKLCQKRRSKEYYVRKTQRQMVTN